MTPKPESGPGVTKLGAVFGSYGVRMSSDAKKAMPLESWDVITRRMGTAMFTLCGGILDFVCHD